MSSRSMGAEPTTSMSRSTSPSATRAMSPISRRRDGLRRGRPGRGIAQEHLGRRGAGCRHIEQGAVAGGGIVAAAAHALEDGVAVQPLGQEAGQPAVAAEERGAGIAGAGPALVAVRVGDDADAVVLLEGVAHDPFEGAPGRVHLHRRLHRVVRELDVGVAAADVGHHHAVLALELLEQGVRVVRVGCLVDDVDRHRRSGRARSGGWSRPRGGSARCGRRRPPCWPTTRSPECTRSGRACRTRPTARSARARRRR